MNNSKRKQAFSLAETIVFVIITAIIIAATTPLLTRKIVNIQDAGSTIGGGQHGRIEIFTKEKLIFNNNEETSYEKLPSPSGPIIRVYEKIDDNTYEEIENVTPEADQNGKTIFPIVKATKIIDNKEVIYTKGKKYIFEDGKINYEEVKYIQTTNKNDKGEFIWEKAKPTENGVVLENMSPKRRVIESRLTKFDGKSIKGNNRWTVEKDNGSIKPQPWQKTYTGNKLVIDKPLLSNKADVQIPQSAANITIHAVGGGGAGGGLSENLGFKNSYEGVSDKTPDILKKQVEDNIDERIKRAEDDLAKATTKDEKHKLKVEIKRLKTLKAHVDKLKIEKGNPATNKQPKETIVVELDVQDGLAFPRDLLTYPSVLGSKTQTMQPLDLKEWFNWDTISNSGFDLTVSGFGSNGGDGGHIIQSIQDYGEDNQVSALKEFLLM